MGELCDRPLSILKVLDFPLLWLRRSNGVQLFTAFGAYQTPKANSSRIPRRETRHAAAHSNNIPLIFTQSYFAQGSRCNKPCRPRLASTVES
ncbi:hypothetical protein I7I50_04073 [Histoplasma capsulatum G186AR]|uniref:Uncharacterized protein n=1 Tax=Ajellomyces capsulatus TaxID=5037 RepID=A0A8H7YJN9_AJECA|nr:hypothetical protein I7I52_04981 [Histoplasma capsulatum]QSS75057.1 hypothetical protein I7I50_04073 [Histoplasma capsulatum G186AR]